ncbi:MAG: barstar family protein [Dehalococcoidia bacterium]|nr:barstar family protein [Dehalococcoidia bacterium]
MEDWEVIFSTYLNSGVYLAPAADADIRDAARAGGLEFAEVDLKGVKDKRGFLKTTAAALGFPSYFGMNWDAFSDCLTDMSWRPAAGYVILLKNHRSFAVKNPSEAQTAERIFDSSAQYWKQKKMPFYVILHQKTP